MGPRASRVPTPNAHGCPRLAASCVRSDLVRGGTQQQLCYQRKWSKELVARDTNGHQLFTLFRIIMSVAWTPTHHSNPPPVTL